jgi:hypothetical protein
VQSVISYKVGAKVSELYLIDVAKKKPNWNFSKNLPSRDGWLENEAAPTQSLLLLNSPIGRS